MKKILTSVFLFTAAASFGEEGGKLGDVRIKIISGEGETVVRMYDNKAAADFAAILPITLKMEDYNGTEKIAYLPRRLDVSGAPAGFTPSAGDFAYYAPWGNIALFYKDFRYSGRLVLLGRAESGLNMPSVRDGGFTVTIQKME